MKIGSQAMNAALADFQALTYSTKVASAYEAYLTAKWLDARQPPAAPSIAHVNEAVTALFEIAPGHQFGRLYPFRYDWKAPEASGRKTVWNNTTRGPTLATSLFDGSDFRGGLLPGAAALLAQALPAEDGTPRKPSQQSLACLVLRDHDFTDNGNWPEAEALLQSRLAITAADLAAIASPLPLGVPLLGPEPWSVSAIPTPLAPQSTVRVEAATADAGISAVDSRENAIVMEPRVERMLRRAVARYPCVLLVGPPGTGKGTLIRWLTKEVQVNPAAFGFHKGIQPNPVWRTPDESWTSFELIGGYTPSPSGKLGWSPGIAMNCIQDDRWLVLDETNRADMDKIMGPLLTWLSEQEVEIARSVPEGGKPIHLGWTSSPESLRTEDGPHDPIRYLAGKDWRLLGTYNPQDAQRVFRFGQALSRRFVVVPVPALRPGQFAELLDASYPGASDEAVAAITGIYTAHNAERATSLGPAVFLRLAQYTEEPGTAPESDLPALAATSAHSSGAALRSAVPLAAAASSPGATSSAPQPDSEPATQAVDDQLLAEAYVLSVGKYLAGFDDPVVEALGSRIVEDEGALSREQWEWVLTQRDILG